MRISSFEIHRQAAEQLQALGADVARTQQQISTGKRIVDPSDDPVGAARVVELKQEMSARDQYVRNSDAADAALALEDSVLAQVTEVLQRVQELTLQAGSGVQTSEDRQFLASEIEARFEELVSLVNTRGPDGQYIFAGFRSDQPPFEVDGLNIRYKGDSGQRQIQVDHGQLVKMNDPGDRIFMRVDNDNVNAAGRSLPLVPGSDNGAISGVEVIDQDLAGALFPDRLVVEFRPPSEAGGSPNYTVRRQSDQRPVDGLVNVPYQDGGNITAAGITFQITGAPQEGDRFVVETNRHQGLLETVQNIAQGLNSVDAVSQPDEFRQLIDATVQGLDRATTNVLEVRAEIGARLNTMDAVKDMHQELSLQLQEVLSEIEDLDFAEAVSNLSYQSFILQAAQESFVRINGLSLFNRLR